MSEHHCNVEGCEEPVRTTFTNGTETLDLCEHHEHVVGDHWRELLAGKNDALRLALEKIGPCVVGWGDDVPSWAEELWSAVNPVQRALGIPETDRTGEPLQQAES